MKWLILRDVINTACNNIMSATYNGVVVGRFTMLVDTANQVVCTVSQTDVHAALTIP